MQLRSPVFGNTHTLNTSQIVRHTFGGDIKVLYDPAWPQIEGFQFQFKALNLADKNGTVTYLLEMAGIEVEILDFENISWRGVFLSPFDVIDEKGDGCSFTIQVNFEGQVI